MHPGRMKVTPSDMLYTSRERKISPREKDVFTHVHSNSWVRTEALGPGLETWQVGYRVAEARILALAHALPRQHGKSRPTFALHSAMIAHGLRTESANPRVSWRSSKGSNRTIELRPIAVAHTTIPGTTSRHVRLATNECARPVVTAEGIAVQSLETTAVDIARLLPVRQSIIEVSTILRALCQFDMFNLEASRLREREIRKTLLALNEAVPSRLLRVRAQGVLQLADPGCQSPGEAILKWLLSLVMGGGIAACKQIRSQYPVRVGGQQYFLDLALPSRMVAIEFDGMTKLRSYSSDERQRLREEKTREDSLRENGWRFIRITSQQMRDISGVVDILLRRLDALGVSVEEPSGPLWDSRFYGSRAA